MGVTVEDFYCPEAGIDAAYARNRRKEYLNNMIAEADTEIQALNNLYEDSFRNDEGYHDRVVLTHPLEQWQAIKAKHERELRALEHGDQVNYYVDRIPTAKQRKFEEFLELRRGKALCPFHGDRNPSFSVKDGQARCFGCGWTGDIIDYIQDLKGFSFQEALEFLT